MYCNKTVQAPWNVTKGKIVTKGVNEDGETELGLVMPDYTPGTEVSIGFYDKTVPCGYRFERAWILKKIPTKDTEMDLYQVTLGRKKNRLVVPCTQIRASELAGKRNFLVGA